MNIPLKSTGSTGMSRSTKAVISVTGVLLVAGLLLVISTLSGSTASAAPTPAAAISEGSRLASMAPGGDAPDTSGAVAPDPTVVPTAVSAAPTAVSTPVLPTPMPTLVPTPMPTPAPVAAPITEWATDPQKAYDHEFDLKIDWTHSEEMGGPNVRGVAPEKGLQMVLEPGRIVAVFGHGSFIVGATEVLSVNVGIDTRGKEAVTMIVNDATKPMTVLFKDFAKTGFSLLAVKLGETLDAELMARFPLSRPTHCGLSAGCIASSKRTLHLADASWNVAEYVEYTAKDALLVTGRPEVPFNWKASTVSVDAAAKWEAGRLGQPATWLVPSGTISVALGVTFGKDQVLIATAPITITDPTGNVWLIDAPSTGAVIQLSNPVSDTLVFYIEGIPPTGMEHMEYQLDRKPSLELVTRLLLSPSVPSGPKAFSASVPAASASAYVFSADGKTASYTYDQPLGVK